MTGLILWSVDINSSQTHKPTVCVCVCHRNEVCSFDLLFGFHHSEDEKKTSVTSDVFYSFIYLSKLKKCLEVHLKYTDKK